MRTGPQAVAAAKASTSNRPGMCQNWTWNLYQSHSVGDVDGDGDADAVDGWKSEPKSARFTDRKPMIGSPGAFSGGSGGFGHRLITIGYLNGEPLMRSTDANGRGRVGNHTLSWFEKNWGLKWLGWSKTISGQPIAGLVPAPGSGAARPPAPKPKPKPTRGNAVDTAVHALNKAKAKPGTPRAKHIKAAQHELSQVPFIKKG